jgi:hypothetical protein
MCRRKRKRRLFLAFNDTSNLKYILDDINPDCEMQCINQCVRHGK